MKYDGAAMRGPFVMVIDERYRVKYVGWGSPPDGVDPNETKLTEGLSNLLYLALTGHTYDEHPDQANAQRAINARRALGLVRTKEGQVAQLALVWWGCKIRPWLGQANLVSLGNGAVVDKFPIHDLPEYEQEIELRLPKDMLKSVRIVAV